MSFQNQATGQLMTPQQPQQTTHGMGLSSSEVTPEAYIINMFPNQIKFFGSRTNKYPLYNHRVVFKHEKMMVNTIPMPTNDYEYSFVRPVYRVPLAQGAKFIN